MQPETRYAKSADVNIAYQVMGEGPLALVLVPGFVSHLDFQWTDRGMARFLRGLASFSRLIVFDKRGTGLSAGALRRRGDWRAIGGLVADRELPRLSDRRFRRGPRLQGRVLAATMSDEKGDGMI